MGVRPASLSLALAELPKEKSNALAKARPSYRVAGRTHEC